MPIESIRLYDASGGMSSSATVNVVAGDPFKDDSYSLMLSIGIQFGALHNGGLMDQVKRAGAAKILAVRGVGYRIEA